MNKINYEYSIKNIKTEDLVLTYNISTDTFIFAGKDTFSLLIVKILECNIHKFPYVFF